jgi:hypothetical protein
MYVCCIYFGWICFVCRVLKKKEKKRKEKTNLKPLLSLFPLAQPGPRSSFTPRGPPSLSPSFIFSPPYQSRPRAQLALPAQQPPPARFTLSLSPSR